MKKKYIWVSVTLLVLFIASVLAGIGFLHSVQRSFNFFYEHPNHVRLASNQLRAQLEEVQKNLLLAATSPRQVEAMKYINAADDAVQQGYESYHVIQQKFLSGDRNQVSVLAEELNRIAQTRQEIVTLILLGRNQDAITLLKTEYAQQAADLTKVVTYFTDISKERGDELLAYTNSKLLNLPFVLIGFSMFMLVMFMLYIWIQQKHHVEQLERIAFYDELTGLMNQVKFKLDVGDLLAEKPQETYMVLKFDIENFKMINELFDFQVGDQVICVVGEVLTRMSQAADYPLLRVARVASDEFVAFGVLRSREENEAFRKRFEQAVNEAVEPILHDYKIRFRYGRYIFTGKEEVSVLMEKLYMAHQLAGLQKHIEILDYDPRVKERVIRDIQLANQMEEALENNDFLLYLQPKYSLKNDKLTGAEALVRWRQADGSIMPPGDFIPLFEKNGFIMKLDMYMLKKACLAIHEWIQAGKEPVTVSVNLSRLNLLNPDLVEDVCKLVDGIGVPRQYIEVEITESTVFDQEEIVVGVMKRLHTEGFAISMDDFGTGYSSLGLLKNMPLDVLKMDREFLTDFNNTGNAKSVVESVIAMAKRIQVDTVAEGVETDTHVALLKELGCDIAQGFYYAKPMPMGEFEHLLSGETAAEADKTA